MTASAKITPQTAVGAQFIVRITDDEYEHPGSGRGCCRDKGWMGGWEGALCLSGWLITRSGLAKRTGGLPRGQAQGSLILTTLPPVPTGRGYPSLPILLVKAHYRPTATMSTAVGAQFIVRTADNELSPSKTVIESRRPRFIEGTADLSARGRGADKSAVPSINRGLRVRLITGFGRSSSLSAPPSRGTDYA